MRQTAQVRSGDNHMTRFLRRVAPLGLLLFVTTLAAATNGDRPPYDRRFYPHWIKVEGS